MPLFEPVEPSLASSETERVYICWFSSANLAVLVPHSMIHMYFLMSWAGNAHSMGNLNCLFVVNSVRPLWCSLLKCSLCTHPGPSRAHQGGRTKDTLRCQAQRCCQHQWPKGNDAFPCKACCNEGGEPSSLFSWFINASAAKIPTSGWSWLHNFKSLWPNSAHCWLSLMPESGGLAFLHRIWLRTESEVGQCDLGQQQVPWQLYCSCHIVGFMVQHVRSLTTAYSNMCVIHLVLYVFLV